MANRVTTQNIYTFNIYSGTASWDYIKIPGNFSRAAGQYAQQFFRIQLFHKDSYGIDISMGEAGPQFANVSYRYEQTGFFPILQTSESIIVINRGFWDMEFVENPLGIRIINVNDPNHARRQVTDVYPSNFITGDPIFPNNEGIALVGNYKQLYLTMLSIPRLSTDATTADNQRSNRIFSIGPGAGSTLETQGTVLATLIYPPVPTDPPPDDAGDPDTPDITPDTSPQGDYAIIDFSVISPIVSLGGSYQVFIRIRNNSTTVPTGTEIPYLVIRQLFKRTLYNGDNETYSFLRRISTEVLYPMQTKDYIVQFRLEGFTDTTVATNNVTLRAELESQDPVVLSLTSTELDPEDISVFTNYDNNAANNIKDLTFTALDRNTNASDDDTDPNEIVNQIRATFIDYISQSLYGELPGEEYSSEYIETVRQAYRVAEKIVWESNKTIFVSFTTPYNPDIRRNATAVVSFSRIGLEITGIVINYGHTLQNDGASFTQVTIRATEYVFQSFLGTINLNERIDERQPVNVHAEEIH